MPSSKKFCRLCNSYMAGEEKAPDQPDGYCFRCNEQANFLLSGCGVLFGAAVFLIVMALLR